MIALTREEAQQVLDALKWFEQRFACTHLELIDTIRARLSAPEPARLGEIMPADEEQLKRIAKLVAPEPEPVAKLFGTLPVYETKQDGILTVNAPPQRDEASAKAAEWQGLTDEEIRNEAKNHVFDESFFSGAIWARGQIMGKNNE